MLRRVESLTGNQNVHRIWAALSTASRTMMLRRHATSIGYDSNFSILDSEDAPRPDRTLHRGRCHRYQGETLSQT
jgi:hypothetical protein